MSAPTKLVSLKDWVGFIKTWRRQENLEAKIRVGPGLHSIDDLKRLIVAHQQLLPVARAKQDLCWEAQLLQTLGEIHRKLGNYDQALAFYQRGLIIAEKLGDHWLQCTYLGGLGHSYYGLGQPCIAKKYYRQRLEVIKVIEVG